MTTSQTLLKAVMRTRANDPVVCGAFADYLLESMPEDRGYLRVDARFKVRTGAVVLDRYQDSGMQLVTITMHHYRGTKGSSSTTHVRPVESVTARQLADWLGRFRS